MITIISIIAIIIVIFLIMYNLLISRRNKVKRSKSNVDVYLTQRFDLIPNLVECVKQYTSYESSILEELVKIRTKYMENKTIQTGEILDTKMNQIILQVENYPKLKASEQYMLLEKNLVKIENQIQAARRIYNMSVLKYNNLIMVFPINILAKMFHFTAEQFFEAEQESKESIYRKEKNEL